MSFFNDSPSRSGSVCATYSRFAGATRVVTIALVAPFATGCPQLLDADFDVDPISSSAASRMESRGEEPASTPEGGAAASLGSGEQGAAGAGAGSGSGGSSLGGAMHSPGGTGGSSLGGGGATMTSAGASSGGESPASVAGAGGTGGAGGVAGNGGGSGEGTGGEPEPPCQPTDELCDGRDNDCDEDVDEGADTCPSDCVGFAWEQHGYMICDDPMSRGLAQETCEDGAMELVQLEDAEENSAVLGAVQQVVDTWAGGGGRPRGSWGGGEPSAWIGAEDLDEDGEWTWPDGTAFWSGGSGGGVVDDGFANWGSGQPNGNNASGEYCAIVQLEADEGLEPGEWNDISCSGERAFVCEAP